MGSVNCESKTLSKVNMVADGVRPEKVASVLNVFRLFFVSVFPKQGGVTTAYVALTV